MPSEQRRDIEEINPYASPAVADGPVVPDRAIGAYQDGSLLVVHCQARLNDVCFKTGQPATRRHTARLEGSTGFIFGRRALSLDLPLSQVAWWKLVRLPFWLGVLAILCFVLAGLCFVVAGFAVVHQFTPAPRSSLLGLLSLVGTVFFGLWSTLAKDALVVKRVRGDWFWISGAHPRFLDHLPPW